jgi:hypothetical protein
MSLASFLEWLALTSGSVSLHQSHYMYLVVLTVHVLALTIFVGTALIIDLRLLGLFMGYVPTSVVLTRLLPWSLRGFLIMMISGLLMFYASPVDKYNNLFFQAKITMLLLAALNIWLFLKTEYPAITEWGHETLPPTRVRLAGGAALTLWAAIIAAGRLIPYQQYWFN